VSFFYQLDTSTVAVPLMSVLEPSRCLFARCDDSRLLLSSAQLLALPEAAAEDVSELLEPAGYLRVFGKETGWQQLSAVLTALGINSWVKVCCFTPHPQLIPALSIALSAPLSATQLQVLNALSEQLGGYELVWLPQAPSLQQPGLLVMDMDSTAIQIECIDEIALLAGVGEQVAAVTARAMNGELDFRESLIARVATLAGAPESVLQQVLSNIPLMPGLEALVSHLQQHKWQVAIASGGFTYFTEALKQRLGLTATFANQLEITAGKLTGTVRGEIVDAARKAQVVNELAQQYQIKSSQTVAIGDGANDLPMLAIAALGVAFHAKPKVQQAAKAAIRQGSLLQLLYLMDTGVE